MKKGFVKIIITAAVGVLFLLGIGVAQTQEQSSLGTGTIRQLDTNEVKVSSNDTTKNYLENKLVAGSNVTLTTNNDGGNETITIASSGGGGGGSAIILDLGDDGTNESTDISEIAVATDTNSIFSEPTADKLLIDPTANWPNADTADALSANGANCSAGNAPLGVDASGAAEGCFDVWTEAENTAAAYLDSSDVGSTIQAYDSELAAIAGLTSAADRGIYFTGSGTASLFTLTGTGRSILDDSSTSAVRTTIGVGTSQSPQFAAVNVGNASDTTLARLSAGDLTVEGNLLYRAGGTDVPITDGGTGTSTASGARTNLGLAIGTDVQAWDAFLDDIGALTDPNDDRILFWDDSAGDIVWLDFGTGLSISGTSIAFDGTANLTMTGSYDIGGGSLEIPNSITLPGTCNVGQLYFDSDATSGQRLYACESTNTWALQGDGGGGGGDSISIDSVAVVDPDFQSGGDIDFVDTSNVVTANINAGVIIEPDLSTDVVAVDGDFLQYDSTGTNFTWRSGVEVLSDIGAEGDLSNEAGLYAALSDVTQFWEAGDTFTSGGTGSGFTVNIDNSTFTATDVITHANIADSDQALTACVYIEDPTADDDLQSIWANKTANDFLLTEIWGESDQTVNFDLQVDDGTPADVNGTDISPAAGEAEDTSLSGDTTLAAGEELDLAITSVSGTPTWVSICWTGNWVD